MAVALSGCAGDNTVLPPANSLTSAAPTSPPPADDDGAKAEEQQFPDIVDVVAFPTPGEGGWSFVVTVSSAYDSPERYADGWRVVGPDGTVYGEHMLTHHHAAEQPFTRTQIGVQIPADLTEVVIEGRDQQYGYGGTSFTVQLGRTDDP